MTDSRTDGQGTATGAPATEAPATGASAGPPGLPPAPAAASLENHAHIEGPFLHGTKNVLTPGERLVAGYGSNYEDGRGLHHIYFTTLESTAAWGAQLAAALAGEDGTGRIYVVEPTGAFEDDPNVTDKRFPGNPTRSYRSREPLVVVSELEAWTAHSPEAVQTMLDNLRRLREAGLDVIED